MKHVFSTFELTTWPQITLVAFMVLFVLLIAWAYRPWASKDYQKLGKLPLDED